MIILRSYDTYESYLLSLKIQHIYVYMLLIYNIKLYSILHMQHIIILTNFLTKLLTINYVDMLIKLHIIVLT